MSSEHDDLEGRYGKLFDEVPILRSRIALAELSGGLTNRNIKVITPERTLVARISSNSASLLAIDRHSEYINSQYAARAGVGAQVCDYLSGKGLLVIDFITGKTYSADDVAANLPRIATSVRTLHTGERFDREFDMFEIQRKYLRIVQERGFRLPDGYLELASRFEEIHRAFTATDTGTVPCNNDLLPANFIDDGQKIWLIDYEYSGNNDPCFELGNIWSEAELEFAALEELVKAYYGTAREDKLARAWLFAQVAKYGWTLWASIQNSISELDFDFWEWGMLKYESMREVIHSSRADSMLAAL